jgi:orotate phosphoribosyltransferase
MNPAVIALIFEQTGALLTGHFLLTSGLHSEKYLQCAKVLQWPHYAESLARELVLLLEGTKPDFVISPAIGGIVIGQEVGRVLGCRAIFAEREGGSLNLRRGFVVEPGENALVVEDVVTTGGSTMETIQVVKAQGGHVLGALSIIDRSGGHTVLGVPYRSLWTLSVPAYRADQCPLCRAGSTPTKPGSRR